MFTGLIERVGRLVSLSRTGSGPVLTVACDLPWDPPLEHGESIAVMGACLTVAATDDETFQCDVLEETLARTTLGKPELRGKELNLERAMRMGARFGGHMVQGHVDGIGTLHGLRREERDQVLTVACSPSLTDGILLKGSIALDGVSLTVTAVSRGRFDVHIIPVTWQETSLQSLKIGDAVNIETDVIGKYVRQYVRAVAPEKGLTLDDLLKAGIE